MKNPIFIQSFSSISALGSNSKEIWSAYLDIQHRISTKKVKEKDVFVAQLPNKCKNEIEKLRLFDSNYKNLDDTVLYAIFSAREAVKKADWKSEENFGVNFGSSRGATQLFEKYYKEFLNDGVSSTLSSPTTTLGNISSWVAHDLQTKGPEISHSITCSTALHSLLNGVAWINSGMSNKFLVGGSEAPLTDFTIAQIKALRVYSNEENGYPCKALDLDKTRNTMVLGEGAVAICLASKSNPNTIAKIEGIGYATEILKHSTSVTAAAECFQKSMKMATKNIDINEVDIIVTHTPGTKRGDLSEINAIKKVFGNQLPFLTTNKWKLGHTFGASGLLSLEFAILMLQNQQAIDIPFVEVQKQPQKINKILVNAVGFGGNAVSILITNSENNVI